MGMSIHAIYDQATNPRLRLRSGVEPSLEWSYSRGTTALEALGLEVDTSGPKFYSAADVLAKVKRRGYMLECDDGEKLNEIALFAIAISGPDALIMAL